MEGGQQAAGSLPAGQYKDVILGLVFLKHASDIHWKSLADNAGSPDIGSLADEATAAVMASNPSLSHMVPRSYGVSIRAASVSW